MVILLLPPFMVNMFPSATTPVAPIFTVTCLTPDDEDEDAEGLETGADTGDLNGVSGAEYVDVLPLPEL